jgi:serine/threonine-protein kinase
MASYGGYRLTQGVRKKTDGCLSDETIGALVEHRLSPRAARRATRHVERCDACRRIMADVVRACAPNEPTQSLSAARARHLASGVGTLRSPPEHDEPAGETAVENDHESSAGLPTGTVVGRYVVVEGLGEGAMGVVYLARDPELGRKVALKLLRTDSSDTSISRGRARMLREAQAMAQLSHPNVITIHDVGTFGDGVFLAMELVEGGTLRGWMESSHHPWREVVAMLRRAGEGLAAAHAAGIVHRDFKPDNVLVGRDGRVRVTDFGLARSAAGVDLPETRPQELVATVTRTGTMLGTPAYMSPEQLAGTVADERSDLFSFCVTFYEALYEKRPFAASTIIQLREAIAKGEIATPSRAKAPSWLRRLVVRGLRPDPADRHPSVRAMIDELDARLSRGRRRVVTTLIACILTGAMAVFVAFGTMRARSRAVPAHMSPDVPTPTAITDVPLPASTKPEALAAYRSALQKLRDGAIPDDDFARAIELDPGLAAAQLRYALLTYEYLTPEAREHLARAVAARHVLSDRDQLLLAAAQEYVQREPENAPEFERRMDEAVNRYPLDAELAHWAAFAHTRAGDSAGAIALEDRALAMDPGFAQAYWFKFIQLAYGGDMEGAQATARTCEAHAATKTNCLTMQSSIDAVEGNCGHLEQVSRQLVALDPESPPYIFLANAAYAQGQPLETVRELLRQHERIYPPESAANQLIDAWYLDVLAGHFDDARGRARELEQKVATDRAAKWHARAALMWVSTLLEVGRPLDAVGGAGDFPPRAYAWMQEPQFDRALRQDPTPRLLLAKRQGGLLSADEFEMQRKDWAASAAAKVPPFFRPFVWLYGYAAIAETAADATRALEEQPKFGPMPHFQLVGINDAHIGTTYFLAGRVAEALPLLRRASRSCEAVFFPLEHTQVQLVLGQALASHGDREGACAAYGVVLSRWGKAKPRSVTAERARALSRSLGCP